MQAANAAAGSAACCLSGARAPAYCLLAADSICRNLKDLLHRFSAGLVVSRSARLWAFGRRTQASDQERTFSTAQEQDGCRIAVCHPTCGTRSRIDGSAGESCSRRALVSRVRDADAIRAETAPTDKPPHARSVSSGYDHRIATHLGRTRHPNSIYVFGWTRAVAFVYGVHHRSGRQR